MRGAKRNASAQTLSLIAIVVFAGVVFLLLPVDLGNGVRSRGEFLSPLLAASALIVSGVALVASVRTAGASFRAEEKVKEDIATLLTALRNLRLRLRLSGYLFGASQDALLGLVAKQRAAIGAINDSTTGYALAVFEGEQSRAAGDEPTEWRLLPLYLLEVLEGRDPEVVFTRALAFERLLKTLAARDIRQLAAYVSDLSESTTLFGEFSSVLDEIDDKTVTEGPSPDELLERFRRIRAAGVDDPEVDMWIAVLEGDDSIDSLKQALERGAKPGVASSEVLGRYE